MKNKVDIEHFAELVSGKMKPKITQEIVAWKGDELMLGGYKDLNPEEYYGVPTPTYEFFDHRQNIVDAYEKKRKHGVKVYLMKHMPEMVVTKLLEML